MKITRNLVVLALLGLVAALAVAASLGIIPTPPEAIAGLGLLPFGAGTVTFDDLASLVREQGTQFQAWDARRKSEYEEMKNRVEHLEKMQGRAALPRMWGDSSPASMSQEQRKCFDGGIRALMVGDKSKADALFVQAKAMNAGTGPDGGYVVHTQFSQGFTKVMAEMSPVYRLARVIPLEPGNDTFAEPIDRDQAEATWTGEQSDRDETDTPQLKLFSVPLHEIYAMPKVTQKLVDVGGFDVLTWLQTKVGEAFGAKESAAFHAGDGVAKPFGFLAGNIAPTADATRAWGTIQYIPSGASGAFTSPTTTGSPVDALIDMTSALKPQYRDGAVWLMNRTTAGVVRKLKDAEGRFVWMDAVVAGQQPTLLGYRVEIDEDMPDIAANSLSIAFGNLKRAYTIVEAPGIKFLPDPYSAKPHVLLYSYRRVGGGMNNSEAIKVMKFSAT